MKKLLIVGIAAAAFGGAPAIAAELPVKAVPVLFDWTGWYGGGNAGYSWGKSNVTVTQTTPAATVTQHVNHHGGQASVEGGYCWQPTAGITVTCFEVQYQFPHEKGHTTIDAPSGQVTPTTEVDPLLIGPHIGFLTDMNRTLWYAAGGLAMGPVGGNASTLDNGGAAGNANPGTKWKAGWYLGAGIERMIDNHWSVKLEYDYVRIGSGGGGPSALITPASIRGGFGAGSTVAIGGGAYDNVITAGINYHFGTR